MSKSRGEPEGFRRGHLTLATTWKTAETCLPQRAMLGFIVSPFPDLLELNRRRFGSGPVVQLQLNGEESGNGTDG